jgi:hypothetical protein
LAIRNAVFFLRAIVFRVRTCSDVHARRFVAFLAIEITPDLKKNGFVPENPREQKPKNALLVCGLWK